MAGERAIRGLGEIAFRVSDLDAMQAFYQDVIGLELLRRFPDSAFFRLADGYGGHIQILALFDRKAAPGYQGLSAERTTVDHIAFEVSLDDYAAELARLRGLGLKVDTTTHAWVKWRSLYVRDPEGNQVELVCYDPSVG
jgi:catechol 2,3-dioxygenase-like lactoylglutathione lyase family enzyme